MRFSEHEDLEKIFALIKKIDRKLNQISKHSEKLFIKLEIIDSELENLSDRLTKLE